MQRFSPECCGMDKEDDGGWVMLDDIKPVLDELEVYSKVDKLLNNYEKSIILDRILNRYKQLKENN